MIYQYILGAAVAIGLGAFLLWSAAQRDARLQALSDCVEVTAKAQGFTGTVEQKWLLFASECNK